MTTKTLEGTDPVRTPTPADRFAFGIWTVGNAARDRFGAERRPRLDHVEAVEHLGDLGAWAVSSQNDGLVPPATSSAERDQIIGRFRHAFSNATLVASMATTNLFWDSVFKDGAFTS